MQPFSLRHFSVLALVFLLQSASVSLGQEENDEDSSNSSSYEVAEEDQEEAESGRLLNGE